MQKLDYFIISVILSQSNLFDISKLDCKFNMFTKKIVAKINGCQMVQMFRITYKAHKAILFIIAKWLCKYIDDAVGGKLFHISEVFVCQLPS